MIVATGGGETIAASARERRPASRRPAERDETARVGELGRGFAIVANKVKTLSGQTNEAVSVIEGEVTALQIEDDAAAAALA